MAEEDKDDLETRLRAARLTAPPSLDERVRRSIEAAKSAANQTPSEATVPGRQDEAVIREPATSTDSHKPARRRWLVRAAGLVAAAAVVLVAMLVWMTSGPKPPMSAWASLSEAMENSKAAEWVHFTVDSSGTGFEGWISFKPARSAIKNDRGLTYTDASARKTYAYSAASNTITVSAVSKNLTDLDEIGNASSLFDAFVSELDGLRKKGTTIEKTSRIVEGKSCDVYKYESATTAHSITVDPLQHRVVRLEKLVSKGLPSDLPSPLAITVAMDYPGSGPGDIYALGAPRDAKVINWGYGEAKALSDKVNAAGDAFAPRHFAIIVRQPEAQPRVADDSKGGSRVTVEYRKDKRFRIEKYAEDASAFASAVNCDDAASLESWTRDHSPRSIEFYDGRNYKPGTQNETFIRINEDGTLNKTAFEEPWLAATDTVEWATWGCRLWVSNEDTGLIVLPIPAKEGSNGSLEGVEKTDPAQNEDRTPATMRYGWYFNSQRDYAAEETVLVFFASRPPRPPAPTVDVPQGFSPAPSYGYEYVGVQKVTEYAQTSAGQWYAKRLVSVRANHSGDRRETVTILLDTTRDIPDDLFDVPKFEADHKAPAK